MDQKIIDKIFGYIDALAAKLGVATQYVLTAIVKQQLIEGIVDVSIYLVVSIIAIMGWKYCFKNLLIEREGNKGKRYSEERSEFWMALHAIVAVLALIAIIIDIVMVPDAILRICNPQYYAFKEILGIFNGQ